MAKKREFLCWKVSIFLFFFIYIFFFCFSVLAIHPSFQCWGDSRGRICGFGFWRWWQVTGDKWHVTPGTWHMRCDICWICFVLLPLFAHFFCTILVFWAFYTVFWQIRFVVIDALFQVQYFWLKSYSCKIKILFRVCDRVARLMIYSLPANSITLLTQQVMVNLLM